MALANLRYICVLNNNEAVCSAVKFNKQLRLFDSAVRWRYSNRSRLRRYMRSRDVRERWRGRGRWLHEMSARKILRLGLGSVNRGPQPSSVKNNSPGGIVVITGQSWERQNFVKNQRWVKILMKAFEVLESFNFVFIYETAKWSWKFRENACHRQYYDNRNWSNLKRWL